MPQGELHQIRSLIPSPECSDLWGGAAGRVGEKEALQSHRKRLRCMVALTKTELQSPSYASTLFHGASSLRVSLTNRGQGMKDGLRQRNLRFCDMAEAQNWLRSRGAGSIDG